MKPLDRTLQRVRINKITPYIRPRARVLDIGCADGALFERVTDARVYVGIDPEAPSSPLAGNVRFIQAIFPTPLLASDEQFDVIAALAVLEHVPACDQAVFAHACARHTALGGLLAISVPSPIVDRILRVLKSARLLDGMCEEQHYGFAPQQTPSIFGPHGFQLLSHRRFELGLNHLFVLQRTA